MRRICLWLSLCVSMLTVGQAAAVTITPNDLPAAYRSCTSGRCNASLASSVDIGAMNAFRLRESAPGAGVSVSWLLRYQLNTSTPTSPQYMWLKASSSYDLSNPQHAVTLLIDQANVPEAGQWMNDADRNDWDFTVTTPALLAGSAQYAASCCHDGEAPIPTLTSWSDSSTPGGKLTRGGPTVCVAEGCYAKSQLNFIYFLYQADAANPSTARLVFDPSRNGSLLYGQLSEYTGELGEPFHSEQNFYIAPVPLPAAWGLLLSALGGLSALRRRQANAG